MMITTGGRAVEPVPALLEGRPRLVLETGTAKAAFDLAGGGLVLFELASGSMNPFTWNYPEPDDMEPRSMGQFICFDRLGRSSPQEIANGMPNHGEAATVNWRVIRNPGPDRGGMTASLGCSLPIAGLSFERTVSLSGRGPVLRFNDTAVNDNPLGSLYNLVQHSAVAPPFLDTACIVDTNGSRGFATANPFPRLEEPEIRWPFAVYESRLVDLRHHPDGPFPGVVNFIFPDDAAYGWVTVASPTAGVLLGYIWNTADYPWVRVWRNVRDGRPLAVGPEFGTTPLPMPFGQILEKGPIWGRDTIRYLDAGERETRSFTVFLAPIPSTFTGVDDVVMGEGCITVIGREGASAGDIVIEF